MRISEMIVALHNFKKTVGDQDLPYKVYLHKNQWGVPERVCIMVDSEVLKDNSVTYGYTGPDDGTKEAIEAQEDLFGSKSS